VALLHLAKLHTEETFSGSGYLLGWVARVPASSNRRSVAPQPVITHFLSTSSTSPTRTRHFDPS
jgi:hypothetical protein